jgi:hypothetical protein
MVTDIRKREMGEHVARMEVIKIHIKFKSKYLKGRDHVEDLDVDRRIILE